MPLVGDKSSKVHPFAGGGTGDGALFFYEDEKMRPLHSSWISRLRLRTDDDAFPGPAISPQRPTATHSVLADKHRISTPTPVPIANVYSSFINRHRLDFSARNPPPPPPIHRAGGESHLITGFGPFQIRDRKAHLQLDEGNVGCDDGEGELKYVPEQENWEQRVSFFQGRRLSDDRTEVCLSPFFQTRLKPTVGYLGDKRPSGGEGNTTFADNAPNSSSWAQSHMRPPRNGNKCGLFRQISEASSQRSYEQQHLSANSWFTGSSVQHLSRNRGTIYHDNADGLRAGRAFCDSPPWDRNNLQCNAVKQSSARLSEPWVPFSFWNMGRFNRTNYVSSVSPAIALDMNLGRKRNPNRNDFISSKSRKLGSED